MSKNTPAIASKGVWILFQEREIKREQQKPTEPQARVKTQQNTIDRDGKTAIFQQPYTKWHLHGSSLTPQQYRVCVQGLVGGNWQSSAPSAVS